MIIEQDQIANHFPINPRRGGIPPKDKSIKIKQISFNFLFFNVKAPIWLKKEDSANHKVIKIHTETIR